MLKLVQARRDRDYHREALHTFENKISEQQRRGGCDLKRHKEFEQKNIDTVMFRIFFTFVLNVFSKF